MGVIQGSINQLLTLATAGIRFSPVGEAAVQKTIQAEEQKAKYEALQKEMRASQVFEKAQGERLYGSVALDVEERAMKAAQELAYMNPSDENIQNYLNVAEGYEGQKKAQFDEDTQALVKREKELEKARLDLRIKQEERRGKFKKGRRGY